MKSNKNKYITLFIVALNLATVLNIYVVSDFIKHKDEIVKSLCVQKDFKVNTCQGKCHLKKELSSAGNSQKENQSFVVTIPQFNYINSITVFENPLVNNSFVFNNIYSTVDQYRINYSFTFLNSIFHPPVLNS